MLLRYGSGVPSMWNELSRFSREMDRFFCDSKASSKAGVFPSLNLFDDGENLVVRAEVPGLDPDGLEITATNNALSIKGERKGPTIGDEASAHRREREYGIFSRSVNLPQEVNPDNVQASYKLGVLEVVLPKSEEAKPRKIQVLS